MTDRKHINNTEPAPILVVAHSSTSMRIRDKVGIKLTIEITNLSQIDLHTDYIPILSMI